MWRDFLNLYLGDIVVAHPDEAVIGEIVGKVGVANALGYIWGRIGGGPSIRNRVLAID